MTVMADADHSGSRRPRRRTTTEVQRSILEAARAAFATEGYSGAATRRIALEAGVAEALIFRHYDTKAGLYRSAVLEWTPWLVREFRWPGSDSDTPGRGGRADRAHAWAGHVLTVVERNRTLLAGLLNHGLEIADEAELVVDIQAVRRELFGVLDRGARQTLDVDVPSVGFSLAVRSVFATFISVSAYGGLFEVPGTGARPHGHRDDLVRLGGASLLAAAAQSTGA